MLVVKVVVVVDVGSSGAGGGVDVGSNGGSGVDVGSNGAGSVDVGSSGGGCEAFPCRFQHHIYFYQLHFDWKCLSLRRRSENSLPFSPCLFLFPLILSLFPRRKERSPRFKKYHLYRSDQGHPTLHPGSVHLPQTLSSSMI